MAAHGTIRPARQRFGRRPVRRPGWPASRGLSASMCCRCLSRPTAPSQHWARTAGGCGPTSCSAGVPGLAERTWPGSALRIGDALVGVQSVRGRCIVTTIDPDTGAQDLDVLRKIHRQFDGTMALNCWVVRGAHIQVGNQVEVVDLDVDPPAAGGWITGAPYSVATSAATVRG